VKIKGPKHSKVVAEIKATTTKKPKSYNPIKNLKHFAHPKKKGY
jgi:hypothetical protein